MDSTDTSNPAGVEDPPSTQSNNHTATDRDTNSMPTPRASEQRQSRIAEIPDVSAMTTSPAIPTNPHVFENPAARFRQTLLIPIEPSQHDDRPTTRVQHRAMMVFGDANERVRIYVSETGRILASSHGIRPVSNHRRRRSWDLESTSISTVHLSELPVTFRQSEARIRRAETVNDEIVDIWSHETGNAGSSQQPRAFRSSVPAPPPPYTLHHLDTLVPPEPVVTVLRQTPGSTSEAFATRDSLPLGNILPRRSEAQRSRSADTPERPRNRRLDGVASAAVTTFDAERHAENRCNAQTAITSMDIGNQHLGMNQTEAHSHITSHPYSGPTTDGTSSNVMSGKSNRLSRSFSNVSLASASLTRFFKSVPAKIQGLVTQGLDKLVEHFEPVEKRRPYTFFGDLNDIHSSSRGRSLRRSNSEAAYQRLTVPTMQSPHLTRSLPRGLGHRNSRGLPINQREHRSTSAPAYPPPPIYLPPSPPSNRRPDYTGSGEDDEAAPLLCSASHIAASSGINDSLPRSAECSTCTRGHASVPASHPIWEAQQNETDIPANANQRAGGTRPMYWPARRQAGRACPQLPSSSETSAEQLASGESVHLDSRDELLLPIGNFLEDYQENAYGQEEES